MKIQFLKINNIKLNPDNPRSISNEKLQQLIKSVKDFPEMLKLRPVIVDNDMMVLGGNMRVIACRQAGITKLPVIKADSLTKEQKHEFIIKDNVSYGEWDLDLLVNWDVNTLADWGLDLDLNTNQRYTDQDYIPETQIGSISKLGDIFLLGQHRLMCGDSTNAKDVNKLMDNKLADMVWTDPPYNVAIKGKAGSIKNDDMSDDEFRKFLYSAYKRYYENIKDGGVIYVAHSDTERINFSKEFINAGFKLSQNLIWNKNSATFSRQDYNWKHESILYGWKPGAAHYYCDDYSQKTVINQKDIDFNKIKKSELVELLKQAKQNFKSTVIDYDRPTISELHPTMKPVNLIQKLIENSSKENWIVLDLFSGSGSTLIACENSKRINYSMELDPKFVDVIIKRWQEYTEGKAINIKIGLNFD